MPHTKSAEKALRQTEKRRLHNRAIKKALKVQVKKFQATLTGGTPEQRSTEFKTTAKKLDKAAAKHVIHKNRAARLKSQLARQLTTAAAKK
jgi:small subunit ribosomal protein S20